MADATNFKSPALVFQPATIISEIAPHLEPDKIKEALKQAQARLVELGGVGQARLIANDPLSLTSLVLNKLSLANPLPGASLEQGFLLSPDRKHLLLVFKPNAPPGDTKAALKLSKYMQGLQAEFASQISKAAPIRLVYVGAFRAALDNETIIRKDTERALLLVSIGLLLLVLCCFRRPWVGALALVPAVAGVFLATLAYSLFQSSIMAIAMGFGGALIAVAVDHGLAYVLLLDRSFDTKGGTVSHELWKIASFPVFTTVGALLVLTLSGIPLFKEVGLFAALGVGLAAFFVHVFFPLAFPSLKGTQRRSFLPVGRFMDRMVRGASWARLAVAVALALVLACFIRFDFQADLNSMNTVTPATRQAEQIVNNTWGSLFERTYIMAQGADQQALRDRANRLGDFLTSQKASNKLSGPLPLIVLLPGPQRQAANLTAWKTFWTPKRVGTLRNDLRQAAQDTGFTPQAFSGFLKLVDQPIVSSFEIPPELFGFLGVTPPGKRDNHWYLVNGVARGPAYQAAAFFKQAEQAGFKVFDAEFFSSHLAQGLASSFGWMLALIAIGVVLLLIFLFMDVALVLTALSPLVFALIATLGVLGVMQQPLTLSSLLLAPVVLGMGLDYGLYLVRSQQRYGLVSAAQLGPFRVTILLGGVSTLLGTGILVFSQHSVLREVGLTTSLGILFALVGTFSLLPPILRRLSEPAAIPAMPRIVDSAEQRRIALMRYRHMEPHPRLFARFKMALDPMFPRLAEFVKGKTVLDIGCGFAVPAAWLLALRPELQFFAIEPNPERVRIAARVLGQSGQVQQASAPDLTTLPSVADTALALDMAHYLDDNELSSMLAGLKVRLHPRGRLVMRVTIPDSEGFSWLRWIELQRMRLNGLQPFFRSKEKVSAMMKDVGFELLICEPSAPGREETWFVAA